MLRNRESPVPTRGWKIPRSRSRGSEDPAEGRMVRGRASAAMALAHRGQVKAINELHHEPGKAPLQRPLVDRWRENETGPAIGWSAKSTHWRLNSRIGDGCPPSRRLPTPSSPQIK